jgi:hypothetical protein
MVGSKTIINLFDFSKLNGVQAFITPGVPFFGS